MIHKFSVRSAGVAEPDIRELGRSWELDDLEVWRDYYVEFEGDPEPAALTDVAAVLGDQLDVEVTVDQPLEQGDVQVAYKRGVVDNESDSIITVCGLLGVKARAGKVATTYRSSSPRLRDLVASTRFNATIEELHDEEPHYDTLVPQGHYEPTVHYDLRGLDDEALAELGVAGGRNLSLAQMKHVRHIQETLGDEYVTEVLLEALDARWSDHCAHTTWKSLGGLLGRLINAAKDVANPNVLSMFHDNAGVWDFYDGHAIAIKAETHNGPSAISGYFGQLTKLGGVLRDILGTGLSADPIGSFEYTAIGEPEAPAPIKGRPDARRLAGETIRAIKEYGNTFGVPMMSSRMTFHPSYRAKPFALGGSIGLLPVSAAQRGTPRPGDFVVLIGGLTGNEGIHGASASSAGATMDTTAVQIGAPLEQVKFRKALIELREEGCMSALTDVGGAGLNSAVGEIGEACGVWINTALVPLKTAALPMWRILLSESQERMLLAVPPEHQERAKKILDRHMVRSTVIGRFADTGRYHVFHAPDLTEEALIASAPDAVPAHQGETGFDVSYELLDIEVERQEVGPPPRPSGPPPAWPSLEPAELTGLLEQVVSDAEVASQHYADSQYDSTVQGNTWYGPHHGTEHPVRTAYWAGTPVAGSPAAAVLNTAFNPWMFDADPVAATRQMFCSLLAGQVLAGVEVHDVCMCDNFYTPHLSENWREWLVGMVDELAVLVRHFGVPLISGKDSSAGSVHTDEGLVSVPPAVFLTALGKVPHRDGLLREQWTAPGNALVRIGLSTSSPVGTVAGRKLGLTDGALDDLALSDVDTYLAALAASRNLLRSGARIGAGGVAAALAQGVLASGTGVRLESATAESLFAEHRVGAVVEVAQDDVDRLPAELNPVVLGVLAPGSGILLDGTDLFTPAARDGWLNSFTARIA
ncbi:phosphoribosylformylglycinamidine synthase subunit PurL [Lentzea roselyniae]|uniref:Phosphoribosylformylglycinamidine synthase subunit PurL n=1 Tax=Lentzea roselyniae TaxID=531940 RepID=A0ABP7A7A6_9PSEU